MTPDWRHRRLVELGLKARNDNPSGAHGPLPVKVERNATACLVPKWEPSFRFIDVLRSGYSEQRQSFLSRCCGISAMDGPDDENPPPGWLKNDQPAPPEEGLSALPTLLLTIKRHLHILRHAKHHWQIPLRAEKSPRCDRTAMIRGFSRPILNS